MHLGIFLYVYKKNWTSSLYTDICSSQWKCPQGLKAEIYTWQQYQPGQVGIVVAAIMNFMSSFSLAWMKLQPKQLTDT